jgi:hypothetical protein
MDDSRELQRSIGRIEGGQTAMNRRLDDQDLLLREIRDRLAAIEGAEQKRKGERGVLLWLCGIVGGTAGAALSAIIGRLLH